LRWQRIGRFVRGSAIGAAIAQVATQGPQDLPEISQALEWLCGAVNDLESAQSVLFGRLYAVTRPEEKANGGVGPQPAQARSPVATEIGALESRLRLLVVATRDVLDRLAV
jgi:hypothetical protein